MIHILFCGCATYDDSPPLHPGRRTLSPSPLFHTPPAPWSQQLPSALLSEAQSVLPPPLSEPSPPPLLRLVSPSASPRASPNVSKPAPPSPISYLLPMSPLQPRKPLSLTPLQRESAPLSTSKEKKSSVYQHGLRPLSPAAQTSIRSKATSEVSGFTPFARKRDVRTSASAGEVMIKLLLQRLSC